jgi:hypothetical protein
VPKIQPVTPEVAGSSPVSLAIAFGKEPQAVDFLFEHSQILPCQLLVRRLAQEIGWMQHGERPDFGVARKGEPASAHAHDALLATKESLRRRRAKTDQNFGVYEFDLSAGEGQTGRRFSRRRGAVSGRPPRHDIGNINFSAIEPY